MGEIERCEGFDLSGALDPFEPIHALRQFVDEVVDWVGRQGPDFCAEGFPLEALAKVREHLDQDRWYEVAFSDRVPRDMWHALEAYAHEGRPLGGFLQAVVANDLNLAVTKADQVNRRCLNGLIFAVNMLLPAESHGSYQRYERWVEQHEDRRPIDVRDHPRKE